MLPIQGKQGTQPSRRRRPKRSRCRSRPWNSMGLSSRVAGVLLSSLWSTGCWLRFFVVLDPSLTSSSTSSSVGVAAVTADGSSAAASSYGDGEPFDGGAVPTLNETRGSRGAPYYMLLGVSGTLQDGFPLRSRLDYNSSITTTSERPFTSANAKDDADPTEQEEYVPALFIGRALVRGFKAYLDVKDAGSREYAAPPSPPRVPNAVVVATGCREHANLYHVYAVDQRQVSSVLVDEPRFLGVSPDAGLVDLLADDEPADSHGRAAGTDDSVRQLAIRLAKRVLEKDSNSSTTSSSSTTAAARGDDRVVRAVAIPLVTGVHFRPTFVESPVVHELKDGTAVTSYAESLALWAGADRSDDLVAASEPSGGGGGGNGDDEATCRASRARRALAWERVHDATRTVERSRFREAAAHPATLACQDRVQLGVGPFQVRLNFPLEAEDLRAFL